MFHSFKNVKVPRVNKVVHLGHNLCEDIFKFNASNVLLILTTNVICALLILNMLTLILEMCCSINTALHSMAVKEIYFAWRVAMHRVWRVL